MQPFLTRWSGATLFLAAAVSALTVAEDRFRLDGAALNVAKVSERWSGEIELQCCLSVRLRLKKFRKNHDSLPFFCKLGRTILQGRFNSESVFHRFHRFF